MKNRVPIAVIMALAALPASAVEVGSKELEPCHLSNHRQEVLCGSHTVFEDRTVGTGRQIEIEFAVVPAVGENPEPDPIVIFAGGPGQAARDMMPFLRTVFSEVSESRSLILIDQRGMGASHPLECEMPEEDLSVGWQEQLAMMRQLISSCLKEWDADVAFYTQDLANADIHEILKALGYSKVNLFGASWGTRSALLYAHSYPEHTRTLVLDGALPVENTAPLHAAVDGDRALRKLFGDCEADVSCREAFPALEDDFKSLMQRLGEEEQRVEVADPLTGEPVPLVLSDRSFGGMVRAILYAPPLSRVLPVIVDQANRGDYRPLLGVMSFLANSSGDSMTLGGSLAIFCTEELARIQHDAETAENLLLGRGFFEGLQNSCSVWPKVPLPAIYGETVQATAPALVLSGDVDPITPPRWGEAITKSLPSSMHVVASKTGHNVSPQGCAPELIAQFIDQASFSELDGSCLQEIERPSFFIDTSGPTVEPNR